jgi:16S rRNA (cytosine1402-N4)-methyltransferase
MSASVDGAHTGFHTPVLYQRVLNALRLRADGRYIDGTIGAGGHSAGILENSSPNGQVLGLDRDPAALAQAKSRLAHFSNRLHLRNGSFAEVAEHAAWLGWTTVDGLLLDLGLSSMQLNDPARGFSFLREGPLDMRFDPTQPTTAGDLVNYLPEDELEDLIFRFGEEPRASQVAREVVRNRPLHTTLELAEVITRAVGRSRRRIHPATRTFQALRIEVNGELKALEVGLTQAVDLMDSGGRLLVISFHSLEDRIVKQYFRQESKDCICPDRQPICTCGHRARLRLLTRKPIRPDVSEVRANPRARSARLRIAERLELA